MARTGRDRSDRHGDRNSANVSCPRTPSGKKRKKIGRDSLVRTPLRLPVAYTGPEPLPHASDPSHDRMRPTGTGACQKKKKPACAVVHRCVASLPRKRRANAAERDGALIRVLAEPRRDRNCEGRRCGRSQAAVALSRETTGGADASITRKVVLPGRRLHEASPTGPASPGPEPLCTGRVLLPEAIRRRPGQKKCPFCP